MVLAEAPSFLSATTHSYLMRSAESLSEAMESSEVPARYALAHVAALRAAAALVAARSRPALPTGRKRRPPNAWAMLAAVAPELADWASYFSAGAAKRAAAEAGSARAVSEHEADVLVRAADRFLAVVEQALGLIGHVPISPEDDAHPLALGA